MQALLPAHFSTQLSFILLTFVFATPLFAWQGGEPANDPWEARINFQDEGLTPPAGYVADVGKPFGSAESVINVNAIDYSYGWLLAENGSPLDLSDASNSRGNGRNRLPSTAAYNGASDQEKLEGTLMHFQGDNILSNTRAPAWGTQNRAKEGYWEIEIPNGRYSVTVSLGDGGTDLDSRHSATIEGITIVPAFIPSAGESRNETLVVDITDGVLTLTGRGGFNTKINYIEIIETTDPVLVTDPSDFAFAPTQITTELEFGQSATVNAILNGGASGTVGMVNNDNLYDTDKNDTGRNEWLTLPTDVTLSELTFALDASQLAVGDNRAGEVIATAKGYFPAELDLSLAVVASPANKVTIPFRMNAAGGEYDLDGDVFQAEDMSFLVSDHPANQRVTDTSPYTPNPGSTGLYFPRRYWEDFSYNIPVENGEYEVVLHMVENFHTAAGKRIFDVLIEGEVVIDDIDLFVERGKGSLFLSPHTTTVTDEVLTIQWLASVNNGIVQAIEILPVATTNTAPQLTGSQEFDIEENTISGTAVGTIEASDAEGAITYSIAAGNEGVFALDPETGALSTVASLDHETQDTYTLTVEVSDGDLTDVGTVTVSVTDVNEAPTIFTTATPEFGEAPLAVSFDASSSSDPDTDAALTYSWDFGDEAGVSTVATPTYTYLAAGDFIATVTVSDGEFSATDSLSIMVTEAVVLSSANDILAFELVEQSGAVTIDTTAHTVAIEVAAGTSVTALTPTISVSGAATVEPASEVAQDFSAPVVYTVTAQDGSEQSWEATVTQAVAAGFSFIEDFDYPAGDLDGVSGGVWTLFPGDNSSFPLVNRGISPNTNNHIALNGQNGTHDYNTLIDNPVDLVAGQPFYFATYFKVDELGGGSSRVRTAVRIDQRAANGTLTEGSNEWVRLQMRNGPGGGVEARIGLAGFSSNSGTENLAFGETIQFAVRGIWDGANTVNYDWTIAPQLQEADNDWTVAGTHTVSGTPVLGRIFMSTTSNANVVQVGPVRLSTDYSEVVTEVIENLPTASFTYDVDGLSLAVDAAGSSSTNGTVTTYAWSFGDGATATGETASHTYTAAGTYNVTLTVTDEANLIGEATETVVVEEPFVATFPYQINFQDATTTPPAGYLTDFGQAYGTKDGGLTYGWIKLSDGSPIDLSQPSSGAGRNRDTDDNFDLELRQETLVHMQGNTIWPNDTDGRGNEGVWEIEVPNGTYEVSLSVGDIDVENNTENISAHYLRVEGVVAIPVYSVDNSLPAGDPGRFTTGSATVNVTDGKLTIDADDAAGQAVNTKINYAIIAEAAALNAAPIVEDQTFSVEENATGSVATVVARDADTDDDLTFAITAGNDAGVFAIDASSGALSVVAALDHEVSEEVAFTVAVSDGEDTDDANVTIQVTDVNEAPTASAVATPSTGAAPLDVAFNATTSTDPEGNIASYTWDFGDGSTEVTGVSVDHQYTAIGTYRVTLTVADDQSLTDQTTLTVTATETPNNAPIASFTANPTTGKADLFVAFNASASNDSDGAIPFTGYAWDFGDGSTGGGIANAHLYTSPGVYTVKLIVTDDDGAQSVPVTQEITVSANSEPVLAAVGDVTVEEGGTITVNISATDADDVDVLTFTTTNLPTFAEFNDGGDGTATLVLRPAGGDVGEYAGLGISVSDGEATDSETITLTVTSEADPCSPISTLTCDDIAVSLPYALNFTGSEGGLAAGDGGSEVGFTMVQVPSARIVVDNPVFSGDVPGYEPGRLAVNNGQLTITSTKGIFFSRPADRENTNSQINALGLGYDSPAGKYSVRTILNQPNFAGSAGNSSQQAGIWFGLNEDEVAKLVLVKVSNTTQKIQLQVESQSAAAEGDRILEFNSPDFAIAGVAKVALRLEVDPASGAIAGFYSVDGAAEVKVTPTNQADAPGESLPVPAAFLAGVDHDGTTATPTLTYAGVFATHRNANASQTIDASFDNFAIEPVVVKPTLSFLPSSVSYEFVRGDTPVDQLIKLSASDNSNPVVALNDDPNSQEWLILPTDPVTVGELTFGIQQDLPPGQYGTTITAQMDGYESAELFFSVTVIDAAEAFFSEVRPTDGAVNVPVNGAEVVAVVTTTGGYELDFGSVEGNAKLFEITAGGRVEVPTNPNDTGGGDAVILTPQEGLKNSTTYELVLDGILAQKSDDRSLKIPFDVFRSTFTTQSEEDTNAPANLEGVSFTPVKGSALGQGIADRFSSLVMGPDGKLYGATTGEIIKRWTVEADGTLSSLEVLDIDLQGSNHPETGVPSSDNRIIIGFTFAPEATAGNLIAYVTHSAATFADAPEWDGKLTRLSGATLSEVDDVLIHLPRSTKDHLTNSVVVGPGNDLFITQGSNSAGGDPDGSWGFRAERLLAAAILRVEVDKLPAELPLSVYTTDDIRTINNAPTNSYAMTDAEGTYNPYATNSPVTLYATGVRNAYDMVFHTNGWLYIPTNGTAGNNSSSPITPASADYVNLDNQGVRRPDGTYYTNPNIPRVNGGETQKDWLFKTMGGSYHGHPNPYRGEFVLNHGGAPYSGLPGQMDSPRRDVKKYPIDLGPDENYLEVAYDFGFNKSPNGAIEYRSNAFGGKLKGMLMVTRFSGQDDLIVLQPGNSTGDVISAFADVPGLQGFDDPLDVIEDPATGNLYLAQYDRSARAAGNQQLVLLRADVPVVDQAVIALTPKRVITDQVVGAGPGPDVEVIIENTGAVALRNASAMLTGTHAEQFNLDASALPATLAPGESATVIINFNPLTEGPKSALLTVTGLDVQAATADLRGLGKDGVGGSNEPSLQYVFNTYNLGIDVGDEDVTTNIIDLPANTTYNGLLGDELDIQQFERVGAGPVTLEPLAVYGPERDNPIVEFGFYNSGDAASTSTVFSVNNTSTGNGQTLNPTIEGALTFDPGTEDFGFFSRWEFFGGRELFSEDALNTFSGAIPHHVRVYALPGEENAYVIATEEHINGFDYQDVVVIARGLRPVANEPVATGTIRINFSDADTDAPEGFSKDFGQAFGSRGDLEYGWVTPGTGTPLSIDDNGRNRNVGGIEAAANTLVHMQYDDTNGNLGTRVEGAWEITLPNGDYEVTIALGDPENDNTTGTRHVANAEGVTVVNRPAAIASGTPSGNFFVATQTVTVADGRLTVDATGGFNTKILYLTIQPEVVQPVAALRINAGGTSAYTDAQGNVWQLDADLVTGESEIDAKTFNVTGTDEDDLYLEYRFAANQPANAPGTDWGYEIPVSSSGPVTVKLHFIEPFFGVPGTSGADRGGAGRRQFDVAIEGQTVLTNLDLNAEAVTPGTLIVKTIEGVAVTDGNLTIDFNSDINNAIISAIEVIGLDDQEVDPIAFFSDVTPGNGETDVSINGFQATVAITTSAGYELDKATVAGNVKLFEQTPSGLVEVPSNSNDTGGGDAITLTPANGQLLEFSTTYVLQLSGVEANRIGDLDDRITFDAFTSQFTTASRADTNPPADLEGVAFTQVSGTDLGAGVLDERFSSMVVGPDGKLYASTVGEVIKRWDMAPDGTLTNLEELTVNLTGSVHPETGVAASDSRLIIGFTFDENATAENLVAYVTHSALEFTNGPEWDGKLTRLSGPNLQSVQDVLIHLPRSKKDHLTNSVVTGPEGDLFISQGSNSAGGDPDDAWGNRPERLLAAAVLRVELDKLPSVLPLSVYTTDDIAVINAAPAGGILMTDGATYNPYAVNSPVTLYATGVRNAYDLVFHSNGWTYIPTNGTAGNRRTSPVTPASADYVNRDPSGLGVRRPNGTYTTDATIPQVFGGETQKDWLFKSMGGSYHGHPNPFRGEYILNHGGAPYSGLPGQPAGSATDVGKYPDNLGPDPNYLEVAFDFGFNKSPNGAVEYQSNAFDGKLKGMVLVTRFSGQDDIIALQPGNNSGDIIAAFENIPGLQGLDDPLEVVEDPTTGNLYVAIYDRDQGRGQQLILLRAQDLAAPEATIAAAPSELIFETTTNGQGPQDPSGTVTITNDGTTDLVISDVSITGEFASQFSLGESAGATIPAGSSKDYTATFAPTNNDDFGYQEAALVFTNNSTNDPEFEVGLHALKKPGYEGRNEPALQDVVDALGIGINVGWTTLTNTMAPTPQGEEVLVPLFISAGPGEVTITPVARYSPAEPLGFGWYTNVDGTINRNQVGVLSDGLDQAQTLFPERNAGSDAFDPQGAFFGIFNDSPRFGFSHTQDQLNNTATNGSQHRARVYPNKNRDGSIIANSFLVTFEDANNGDYQDYCYILTGVAPYEPGALVLSFAPNELDVTASNGSLSDPSSSVLTANSGLAADRVTLSADEAWVILPGEVSLGSPMDFAVDATDLANGTYEATVTANAPGYAPATLRITATVADEVVFSTRINFQDGSFTPPSGYTADEGAAYGSRGEGLTFGWIDPATKNPTDNFDAARGAARGVTNASPDEDKLLRSLNMFDRVGRNTPRDWEIAVPNGTYVVELAAGDPDFFDSRHTIRAEGETVIDDFVPSAGNYFAVGRVTVDVLDGKLTLDDVGAGAGELGNSKILYVNIAPVGDVGPTVAATLDGNQDGEGKYRGNVTVTLDARDAGQSGGIQSIRYSLDGGTTFENYAAPFTLSLPDGATQADFTLNLEATDANDRVGTNVVSFTIVQPSGAIVRYENLTKVPGTDRGFPAEDYFTFHRLRNPENRDGDVLKTHDQNVVRIHNDGVNPLLISSLSVDPDNFTVTGITIPPEGLTVAPGDFVDATLTFVRTTGPNGVLYTEDLVLVSNADNGSEATATLRGAYMIAPEGGREFTAQQIFQSFGWLTEMGRDVDGNIQTRPSSDYPTDEQVDSGREGDMILSELFVAADDSQPVQILQLAALHGPGGAGTSLRSAGGNNLNISYRHGGLYHQSLLPKLTDSSNEIANTRGKPGQPFLISIANYRTTGGGENSVRPDELLGVRVYRVIDKDGKVIPNEYIVNQDYIGSEGCGAGSANCDWNDNTAYIINARPQGVPTALAINDTTARVFELLTYDVSGSFANGYPGNRLTYTATLADGSPLPGWIQIDEVTGTLTANAPYAEVDNVFAIAVTATDYNLLTAASTFVITVEGDNVTCTVDANSDGQAKELSCDNATVQLSGATSTGVYRWTGPKGFSSSEENPTVSESGIYTLATTDGQDPNTCPVTSTVEVTENVTPVVVTISAPTETLTCSVSEITLTAGSDDVRSISYQWSNAAGTVSEAGADLTVTEAGVYTVTATAVGGCTGTVAITIDEDLTVANAGNGGALTVCSLDAPVDLFAELQQFGGAPESGGTWALNGTVVSNTLDPGTASEGTYRYTIAANGTCPSASADIELTINAAITYYPDVDEDNFGDGGGAVASCTPIAGFVTVAGDCDDSDAGINPNATEVCDNLDNNCNGSTDEGLNCGGDVFAVRINAGGPAVSYLGEQFAADNSFAGGKSYTNNAATVPTLYKTERSADAPFQFSYDLNVPNGTYEVKLHFAEIYFGANGGGPAGNSRRRFDVTLENTTVLDNYDINADVGPQTATVKTYQVTVTDGEINIGLDARASSGGIDQPKLSALEVVSTSAGTQQSSFWLEAECAAVGSTWVIAEAAGASEGAFTWAPNSRSTASAPADAPAGRIRFSLNGAEAGTYYLYARMDAPNSSEDSYWVRINGGPWQRWWQNLGTGNTGFQWRAFTFNTFQLSAGANTVDFAYREGRTKLDKVYVSKTPGIPSGIGSEASNCQTVVNQPPVAVANFSLTSTSAPAIVRLDGTSSSDADGTIVSYGWSLNGGPSFSGQIANRALNAGEYTVVLTVTDNNGATATDVANFTITPTDTDKDGVPDSEDNCPDTPNADQADGNGNGVGDVCDETASPVANFWLEAECATIGSRWLVANASAASRSEYVWAPNDNSTGGAPADIAANRVRFTLDNTEGGTFLLYARVNAPSGQEDSYWVRINGGPWQRWWQGLTTTANAFTWKAFTFNSFRLADGSNTIDFAFREGRTKLDKIYVTKTASAPSGQGATASNCEVQPNRPPIAVASATLAGPTGPTTVQLDGRQSSDPDGSIIRYRWSVNGGAVISGANPSVFLPAGDYTAVLTVLDDAGATATDEVSFTIQAGQPTENAFTLEAECAQVGSGFVTTSRPNASNGSVVFWNGNYSSTNPPADVAANRVRFTVENAETGTYSMFARVRGDGSTFNSFWIRVNGGAWARWFYGRDVDPSGLTWKQVDEFAIQLGAGVNTIDFAYREPNTFLDKVHLNKTGQQPSGIFTVGTNCGDSPPAPRASTFWMEAECATVGSNFRREGRSAASNGDVVSTPLRSDNVPPADVPANRVRFVIDNANPGTYNLFARVRGDFSSFDSYWVRVNGGTWLKWFWRTDDASGLVWNEVIAENSYTLTGGTNTIDFAYREPNVWLDKIHLNQTGAMPSGQGGAATNCSTATQPMAAKSAKAETSTLETAKPGSLPAFDDTEVLKVYPNPVVDRLNFKLVNEHEGDVRAFIVALNGGVVREVSFVKVGQQLMADLQTADLVPGSYLLRIVSGEEFRQKIFIKIP